MFYTEPPGEFVKNVQWTCVTFLQTVTSLTLTTYIEETCKIKIWFMPVCASDVPTLWNV